MEQIYILLGSNLGDRILNFERAIDKIENRIGPVLNKSSYYQTSPWGFESNDEFLNMVIEIQSELSANKILNSLLEIENELGRVRSKNKQGYESRTIDLDILFFGESIINQDELIVPHPRMQERRFVLEPLNEIASNFIHPINLKSVERMLTECEDGESVRKLD